MLNISRGHVHFNFLANEIIWSRLLIQIHILIDKQCKSKSVGFWKSHLIWLYTVCKGWVYPDSAGQGLIPSLFQTSQHLIIAFCDSDSSCPKLWISFMLASDFHGISFVIICVSLWDFSNNNEVKPPTRTENIWANAQQNIQQDLCDQYRLRSACTSTSQSAFYVNLNRAVIGPSG